MITVGEIQETNNMISRENLDVRTITLGISLLDCIDADLARCCDKIYAKITRTARNLVATGEDIYKSRARWRSVMLLRWISSLGDPLLGIKDLRARRVMLAPASL